MSDITAWFWISIGCLVVSVILFAAARTRPPLNPNHSRHISAYHGGVAIGGDNKGDITTNTAGSQSPRNFWQVAGVIIGIAGIAIAVLAWLFPTVS